MPRIFSCLMLVLALIVFHGCGGEPELTHIDLVKNGKLPEDGSRTIGDISNNYSYLSTVDWKEFESFDKRAIVLMTGTIGKEMLQQYNVAANQDSSTKGNPDIDKILLKVQFSFDEAGETFEVTYVGYESVAVNGEKIHESGGTIGKISEIINNEMSAIVLNWCKSPLQAVKNMKISDKHTKTIGEAFESYTYFVKLDWTSKKKNTSTTTVTVTGTYSKDIEKFYMGALLNPVQALLKVEFDIDDTTKKVDLKKAVMQGTMKDGTAVKGTIPMKMNIPAEPIEILLPIFSNDIFGKDMFKSIMWSPLS